MQNLLSRTTALSPIFFKPGIVKTTGFASALKTVKYRFELICVLTLLGSATAYCAFALLQLA